MPNAQWNIEPLFKRDLLIEKIKSPAFFMPDGTPVYVNKFGRWFVNYFDPEKELAEILSQEIAKSVDDEILRTLMALR